MFGMNKFKCNDVRSEQKCRHRTDIQLTHAASSGYPSDANLFLFDEHIKPGTHFTGAVMHSLKITRADEFNP